jgi:hypothetical protein
MAEKSSKPLSKKELPLHGEYIFAAVLAKRMPVFG